MLKLEKERINELQQALEDLTAQECYNVEADITELMTIIRVNYNNFDFENAEFKQQLYYNLADLIFKHRRYLEDIIINIFENSSIAAFVQMEIIPLAAGCNAFEGF